MGGSICDAGGVMEGGLEGIKAILGLSKSAYMCSATPYGLVYSIFVMAVTVIVVSVVLWRRSLRRAVVAKVAVVN